MRIPSRLILVLWAVVILLGVGRGVFEESYNGPGPLPRTTDIVIPAGDTGEVSAVLAAEHVIRHRLVFRAAVWLTRGGGPIRAGEFRIRAHASLHEVLYTLRHAPPVEHQMTVPPGRTAIQIADLINALPATKGHVAPPPEGTVLPETYDYTYGTSRKALLNRAETAMRKALAKSWAGRADHLPLKNRQEALTLASIVQLESPKASELPRIAAVYENRLAKGMKLQADPTVIYAVTKGSATALTHQVTDADLATASPYNTYRHKGLPPGPICAPGKAALNAVLHPAQTDDLYFVASGTGGSLFARTMHEQLANIAHYRRLRAMPAPPSAQPDLPKPPPPPPHASASR